MKHTAVFKIELLYKIKDINKYYLVINYETITVNKVYRVLVRSLIGD